MFAKDRSSPRSPSPKRLVFVSTFPPTLCGIASFTSSLVDAISEVSEGRQSTGVIRMIPHGDGLRPSDHPRIIADLTTDDPSWPQHAISSLRRGDFLWVQHEYGIFGPNDGSAVLDLTRDAPIPVAVTLHTVPGEPTTRQRAIIESLGADARWVVVMSEAARKRLLSYEMDPSRIRVIPHGASIVPSDMSQPPDRPIILNWGLIGPGKGLEWGIEAMAHLRHLDPAPLLRIEGITHPNVLRREGETYRARLRRAIADLGVEDMVEIDSGYLGPEELTELMRRAQLVLLPYDSTDQVTSGVLVEAIGAGIPVIATAFPHAVELLSGGAGVVVPHRSPVAIATAIEHLLTEPDSLRDARARARQVAHGLAWPKVATQYMRLANEIAGTGTANVA